ncbi:phosphoglucan phosphatase chloroplastic-like [Raphidocelis subcapitata]|uniref:Phosphoglucan phosphatase chloroplastic-like n=1 Tax=Raphidocelis subcapitata TaxID=307507 RepID=A0A2V0PKV4_9CHLO|nr:phosphoglucan phosphatase chloroplastic-like [Raphidocelis subcapitata]|eukprot:GBF97675.1 phosphoglucan phosphatase chloroplastic-like [Raphidocelis subcapitata]
MASLPRCVGSLGAPVTRQAGGRAAAAAPLPPRQQQRATRRRRTASPPPARLPAPPRSQPVRVAEAETALDDTYNEQMARQMGWSEPFSYHFNRGLYFHEVWPRLLCGTQPRSPAEVEELVRRHGVAAMVNLQQDKDMQHWGVDYGANAARAAELGVGIRRPSIIDFSPDSLRHQLPRAVRDVVEAMEEAEARGGRVYVHCTAGLGRAPAVCIAYLYWFQQFDLDDAYARVTQIRPCGPRRDSIRAATADLMMGREDLDFDRRPGHAFASMNDQDREAVRARVRRA